MYKLFIKELNENITTLNNQCDTLKGCLLTSENALRRVSPFFAEHCNYSLEEIKAKVGKRTIKILVKETCPEQQVVLTLLNDYRNYLKDLKETKDTLKKEKKKSIPLPVYRQILKSYNKYLRDLMVNTGYVYNMPFNCGAIRVIKKVNTRPVTRVNWFESNKLKALLISQGKTPYNKETAPNGVKWIITHSNDYDVWYAWGKSSSRIPNVSFYSFRPVDAAIKLLNAARKENPLIDYKYTDYA